MGPGGWPPASYSGTAQGTNSLLLRGSKPSTREVTDKGPINQRMVIQNRADLVDALYNDDPSVVTLSRKSK
ncbi:hypothetical protein E0J21_33505 [Rhizobium laguerreae]|nr:hypothetical protein E0J21_33505 [Rhizobium laguerreae]